MLVAVPWTLSLNDHIDWSLPDQLVFSTISALLRVASLHPEHSEVATGAIFDFISDVNAKIPTTARTTFP